MTTQELVQDKARRARAASVKLRTLSTQIKNDALENMAQALCDSQAEIFEANARDLETGRERGLTPAMLDRLKLDSKRIGAMAEGCRQVAALPDPVGTVISGGNRPNGLNIAQVRVPLGVVGIIYESRPNVTIDAAILCLKSGNAAILRGGSEAIHSNAVLTKIASRAASEAGVPEDAIQFIDTTDRAATNHLATMNEYVDLLIPRGGEGLKKALSAVATVPVIYAAGGVCHVYVDEAADIQMAVEIALNAKVSRPSTCNALETLLVHQAIAPQFLPAFASRARDAQIQLRGDEATRSLVPEAEVATEDDWAMEYLDLRLAVRIVDDLDAAVEHIGRYGTSHSEAIVTTNFARAEEFCARVDAAAVYVNASTRFTDGFEFGLGAEIGISTQKLHARGPLGLEALTSNKFIVRGQGQLRN